MTIGIIPLTDLGLIAEASSSFFQWPMSGYTISQAWGKYSSKRAAEGKKPYHSGIDMVSSNKNIYAAADGTVIYRGFTNGNGNHVIIEHTVNNVSIKTLYSHLDSFANCPNVNQRVTKGTVIGIMGNTGNSFGAHLHFGMFTGASTDPLGYTSSPGENFVTEGCTYYNPKYIIENDEIPGIGSISKKIQFHGISNTDNTSCGIDGSTTFTVNGTYKYWFKDDIADSNHYINVYLDGNLIADHISHDSNGYSAVVIDSNTIVSGYHELRAEIVHTNGSSSVTKGFYSQVNDTQPPVISNVKILNFPSGYYIECDVTDNVGVLKVLYPSWTIYNNQDDIIWHEGTLSGNKSTCWIPRESHNNETGMYTTHIYAYDYNNRDDMARQLDVGHIYVGDSLIEYSGYTDSNGNWIANTSSTPTVSGTAEFLFTEYDKDTNYYIDIYLDGNKVESNKPSNNGQKTYKVNTLNLTNGTHTIEAKLYDSSACYSASKTFNVSNTNKYTVTYNANGGSGAPSAQTKTYGTSLTLSSTKPTKTGYTFTGWNTKADGSGTAYASGASYTANAAVTLYAQWKINTFTVSYNANGGSGAPSAQTKTYGTALTLSSTKPTRTGYTFNGWNTKADGSGTNYASGASYTANAAVTLYAQWKINTFAVSYNANGGSGAPSAQTKTYGTALTLSSTKPTRTGYTFNGWNTKADGTGTNYASGATYSADADVTLYAKWTANPYTVTFNANGGTCSTTSKSVTYASTYGTLPTPTRTGYTFNGWYTASSGGAKVTSSTTVSITAAQTLYAQWTANTGTKYVVNHYQMNVSGSGYTLKETENKTGTTASSVTVANLKKTYTGFTFEGGKGATASTATKPSTLDTTTTVLADGTRVINLYYSRNKYALTLSKGTGISAVTGAGTYYYGQSVTVDATVTTGYTWSKWSDGNTTKNATITMPANALTLTASAILNSYSITYTLNGGTVSTANPTSYNVTTAAFTLNNPTRTGYTFAGWTGTGLSAATKTVTVAKGSTGNRSYTATWTANTGTKYVVNHYQMNVSGSGYTLKETENKTGTTASSVTVANLKKTYTGFTFEGGKGATAATATKPSALDTTTTVLADGTRVINLYYSRNKYALTLSKGTGISTVTGAGTYYYGQSLTVDATVSTGYTWSKWSDGNTTKNATITMPANALTLTANATLNTYTISYTLNGGSIATANPTSYSVTTAAFTLNNPTRTGYTFTGWTGTGLSAATKTVTVAKGSTGNRTYTATWTANTYTVTFDANGGTTPTANKTVTYDSTYGELPVPTRTGYTFNGWYTAKTGGTKITADTKVTITSAQTLYAQWEGNTYTVSFDPNGGTCATTSKQVTYGSKYGTLPVPVRENHTFLGWYTAVRGGSKITENDIVSLTDNITLYAQWDVSSFVIKYYNNNSYSNMPADQTVPCNEKFMLSSQIPTRSGYEFAYWEDYEGNKYYSGQECIFNENTYVYDDGYVYMFARWTEVKSYTIKYDANGGAFAPDDQAKLHDVDLTLSNKRPIHSISEYSFVSWNTKADGTGVSYESGAIYSNNADLTLYAQWKKNVYIVTYDANGGTGAPSFQTKEKYVNLVLSTIEPTRVGYIFKCWNTSKTGLGKKYAPGEIYSVNDSVTLYAIWEHDTFMLKNSSLTIDNSIVSGTDLFGITQSQLESQFSNKNISITMKDHTRTATGTSLNLVDSEGKVYDTLTVVIFGDVNGDGWYDGEDAFIVNLIAQDILNKDDVGTAIWTAADCNHDGVIDEADVDLLSSAGLKLNEVDQTKTAAELATNADYIEYVMLIDQSAGMHTGIIPEPDTDDALEDATAPETNEDVESDETATDNDIEVILTYLFELIKKIFTLVFSFIIK